MPVRILTHTDLAHKSLLFLCLITGTVLSSICDTMTSSMSSTSKFQDAVVRPREPTGETPIRESRRRTEGLVDQVDYRDYDPALVEKAVRAGMEPWEGRLCPVCEAFTANGELCCTPSPRGADYFEAKFRLLEMFELLDEHDEEIDFKNALTSKGYGIEILQEWSEFLPENCGDYDSIPFHKIWNLTAACESVIGDVLQKQWDTEEREKAAVNLTQLTYERQLMDQAPPQSIGENAEEIKSKFQALGGCKELCKSSSLGKILSRGTSELFVRLFGTRHNGKPHNRMASPRLV